MNFKFNKRTMNKSNLFIPLTALLFVGLLAGCSRDEDTTRPVVDLIQVNGEDGEEVHLDAGTTMTVLVRVSDDEDLNQLKVNIHSAGDGHDHEGEEEEEEEVFSIGNWSENYTTNLGGQSDEVNYEIDVPSDIAGFWHLEVQCIDKEGNEADPRIVTLHIENSNLPEIDITSTDPVQNAEGEIVVSPGGSITFTGAASASLGIEEVHFELEDESTETVVWEMEYEAAGASTWDFGQAEVVVPESTTSGSHLHLHIHVIDTDGLEMETEFEVHVE